MQKVPADVIEALRLYAAEIARLRGEPSPEVTDRFMAARYTREQALEVVLGVCLKTLSNYTNHIARTPLDKPFAAASWKPASGTIAATAAWKPAS